MQMIFFVDGKVLKLVVCRFLGGIFVCWYLKIVSLDRRHFGMHFQTPTCYGSLPLCCCCMFFSSLSCEAEAPSLSSSFFNMQSLLSVRYIAYSIVVNKLLLIILFLVRAVYPRRPFLLSSSTFVTSYQCYSISCWCLFLQYICTMHMTHPSLCLRHGGQISWWCDHLSFEASKN